MKLLNGIRMLGGQSVCDREYKEADIKYQTFFAMCSVE